jgi:hypothetical protein
MRGLAAAAMLGACGGGGAAAPVTIDLDTDPGLSGLAVADDGALWTVAERSRGAYRIELDGDRVRSLERFEVTGVPAGDDLEAIEVAGATFWLGSEGNGTRSAQVWTAALDGEVLAARPVPHTVDEATHVIAENHGVEGLCGDASAGAIALETAIAEGDRRVAQVDLRRGDTVTPQRVVLTSPTGKLAGIDCEVHPDRLDVLAIERHFEVTRVIRFSLRGEAEPVAAEVVRDLADLAKGRNFEGLARLGDGRIALVTDNQWKTIEGPSQLVILPAP